MSELHAALGLVVLKHFERERILRKSLTETYRKYLNDIEGIHFLGDLAEVESNYAYFVIRINKRAFGKDRDWVCQKLRVNGIVARKYFHPLVSDLPHYRHLPSASREKLPVAHKATKEVLCLPLYGGLDEDVVRKICGMIKISKKTKRN